MGQQIVVPFFFVRHAFEPVDHKFSVIIGFHPKNYLILL